MKLIYICSPFRGSPDTKAKNVFNAQLFCRFVANSEVMPFAPHLYFPQFLDDEKKQERNFGLSLSKRFMNYCEELWICGEHITEGMREEIKYWNKIKKSSPKRVFIKNGTA